MCVALKRRPKAVAAALVALFLALLLGWHLAPGGKIIFSRDYPDCARFPCTYIDTSDAATAPLYAELKVGPQGKAGGRRLRQEVI